MDADATPSRSTAPPQGGSVERIHRVAAHAASAATAQQRGQAPVGRDDERYELRDPFAEVTYRATTLREITDKAEQIGGSRVVAVSPDGQRTLIDKVGGQWQRGAQLPARPERPIDPLPRRDEVPEVSSDVVPIPGTSKAAAQPQPVERQPPTIDTRAERNAQAARLEAALLERYVIKRAPVTAGDVTLGRTEYRFRGDTSRVAFTESAFRLATDTNSPSVARSMVDVAEARNWKALRVSGNEDFKRMVWLEATVRGVKAVGYEPSAGDLDVLRREREARQVNRIEPARDGDGAAASATGEKASARGSGGRKAVLAAIEAVLIDRKVPEKQRVAVMEAAAEKLVQRLRDGQAPKVKIYDKGAPPQRPVVVPTPEHQRSRDRSAPVPVR